MGQFLRSALRWVALCLALACVAVHAQNVLPVPPLTAHVVDQTGTFSESQRQALEAKLTAFEAASGAQVVVLMVPTTQPEDIFGYANRVANVWKIGRKDIGDGLLLLVAKNDRRLRIEVAKTLEGAIPDLAASQIIDAAITPRFKQGDFAGGVDAGVDQIMARIKGEALPAPTPAGTSARNQGSFGDQGFQWMDLAIFLFIAVPVGGAVARRILGNKLGSIATGGAVGALAWFITASVLLAGIAGLVALVFTLIASATAGRVASTRGGLGGLGGLGGGLGGWSSGQSRGGGFGGGGGGFSSGGGGNFGGGGASGGW